MAEHGEHEWARYAGVATGDEASNARKMAQLREREREVVKRAASEARAARVSEREKQLWQRGDEGLSLLSDARASELSDRLEQVLDQFPLEVAGKRVGRGELRKMARGDDASLRREQRRAMGKMHREAAPLARQLFKRRAEVAASLGKKSFFDALLALRGVEPARLTALFERLRARTEQGYARAVAEASKNAGLSRPALWDIDHLSRKVGEIADERFSAAEALPLARRIWSQLGVDLDRPKVRIDVRDFAFGGQTISIRVPDDVRAVVSPSPGAKFYMTLMHELGHAFAATRNREGRAIFRNYEWVPGLTEPACDEGVAEVFGRIFDEAPLLEQLMPQLSADERERHATSRKKGEQLSLRVRLAAVAFEREAQARPDADLDGLSREIERRYLGGLDDEGAEPIWATSPFFATYPSYMQSYTLAAMLSCQVRAALRARLGPRWVSAQAGELLTSFVHDGTQTTADEKLTRLTGRGLDEGDYVAWLEG